MILSIFLIRNKRKEYWEVGQGFLVVKNKKGYENEYNLGLS